MRKFLVLATCTIGMSVFALGGATAGAAPAINCAGLGNPGQAAQFFGAAGPNRVVTPPQLAASLGAGATVGSTIQTLCVTPAT